MTAPGEWLRAELLAEVALAALVLEGLALAVRARSGGSALPLGAVVIMLLPGAFLLLAVRAAAIDAGGLAVAAYLTAALLAHLADVRRRHARSSARGRSAESDGP